MTFCGIIVHSFDIWICGGHRLTLNRCQGSLKRNEQLQLRNFANKKWEIIYVENRQQFMSVVFGINVDSKERVEKVPGLQIRS